jgi:hypothetical protein
VRPWGLLLLAAALARPLAAADDGGQPEAWTKLDLGARNSALGGAAAAVVGDPFAAQWNPALLCTLDAWHLQAQSALLPDQRNLEFAGFARPVDPASDWGWGVAYAQVNTPGGLEARSANTPAPDASFGDSATLSKLGLAGWAWGRSLALGLDLKVYSHQLDQASAAGVSEDLGALWRAQDWLDAGLDLEDALNEVTWNTGLQEHLPLALRLSAAARFFDARLMATLEAGFSAAQDPQFHAGLEGWVWPKVLALRLGCDQGRLAAGLGAKVQVRGVQLGLDYAAAGDASASDQLQNRLSLDLSFNP